MLPGSDLLEPVSATSLEVSLTVLRPTRGMSWCSLRQGISAGLHLWYEAQNTNLRVSSLALNSCTLSLWVFFAVCFALSSRCKHQLHPLRTGGGKSATYSSLLSLQESPLRFRHLRSIFSPFRSRRRGPSLCAHFPLARLIPYLLVLLLNFAVDFGAVRRRVRFLLLLPARKWLIYDNPTLQINPPTCHRHPWTWETRLGQRRSRSC